MKFTAITKLFLPATALTGAALLLVPVEPAVGYSTLGGSLGYTQRDLRVYNNFPDAASNNNNIADEKDTHPSTSLAPLVCEWVKPLATYVLRSLACQCSAASPHTIIAVWKRSTVSPTRACAGHSNPDARLQTHGPRGVRGVSPRPNKRQQPQRRPQSPCPTLRGSPTSTTLTTIHFI